MNTCDEDIEADDKIIAEEGERELYEHFRFVADKGQNLLRVDKFLVARLESSPVTGYNRQPKLAVFS